MGDVLHSFDRTIAEAREQAICAPQPHSTVLIRACGAAGTVEFDETMAVNRPAGVLRQRDQLLRAVRDRFPDARLHSVSSDGALFIHGDWIVTARYGASF